MTDRGLYARWLFQVIVAFGWHPVLRVTHGGTFLPNGCTKLQKFRHFVCRAGQSWTGRGIAFPSTPQSCLACTLLAYWAEGYKDGWYVLTDLRVCPDSARSVEMGTGSGRLRTVPVPIFTLSLRRKRGTGTSKTRSQSPLFRLRFTSGTDSKSTARQSCTVRTAGVDRAWFRAIQIDGMAMAEDTDHDSRARQPNLVGHGCGESLRGRRGRRTRL